MPDESRVERWQRTGVLHLVIAAIVFATWVYFQATMPAAERPVALNEILLAVFTWMAAKFVMKKTDTPPAKAPEPEPPKPPEPEPESRGRHAQ